MLCFVCIRVFRLILSPLLSLVKQIKVVNSSFADKRDMADSTEYSPQGPQPNKPLSNLSGPLSPYSILVFWPNREGIKSNRQCKQVTCWRLQTNDVIRSKFPFFLKKIAKTRERQVGFWQRTGRDAHWNSGWEKSKDWRKSFPFPSEVRILRLQSTKERKGDPKFEPLLVTS